MSKNLEIEESTFLIKHHLGAHFNETLKFSLKLIILVLLNIKNVILIWHVFCYI